MWLDMICGNRHPGIAIDRLPAKRRLWAARLALAACLAVPAAAPAAPPDPAYDEPSPVVARSPLRQPEAEWALPPEPPERSGQPVERRTSPVQQVSNPREIATRPEGENPGDSVDRCPHCGAVHDEEEPDGDAGGGVFRRQPLRNLLRCPWGRDHQLRPIVREGWLRRPFSVGWFLGGLQGSTLVSDWVDQREGIYGGLRCGYDINNYWGTEFRLGFASGNIVDSRRAIDAQVFADNKANLAWDDPFRRRYDGQRTANSLLYDIDVLYYPWGDNPWRPFLMIGLGGAHISFQDRLSTGYDVYQLTMPLGVGLKYRLNDVLALRVECDDNISFANGGVNTLHQFAFMGAAEFRFGGSRKTYWPWNPGRSSW